MAAGIEFSRSALLLGEDAIEALARKHVVLFGLGGVGSFVMEALARTGVGRLTLVDGDCVDVTNINRQLIALRSTVGRRKTETACERIADINPDCRVTVVDKFIGADDVPEIIRGCDYAADAIDTVSAKLAIAEYCNSSDIPLISCMGMGNKLDPTQIRIADIYETRVCPLCRVMRRELRERGINGLKVVYSPEESIKHEGGRLPGSVAFVPSAAGLIMASEIIRELIVSE